MNTRTSPLVQAASATLLAVSAPAVVTRAASAFADDSETQQITVHFADLDLTTPNGAKQLYMRLKGAAEVVCGDDDADNVFLEERRAIWHCEQESVERAVAQVDHPLLTALYDKHYPHEAIAPAATASLTGHVETSNRGALENQHETTVRGGRPVS
jgi:UrcA family protein